MFLFLFKVPWTTFKSHRLLKNLSPLSLQWLETIRDDQSKTFPNKENKKETCPYPFFGDNPNHCWSHESSHRSQGVRYPDNCGSVFRGDIHSVYHESTKCESEKCYGHTHDRYRAQWRYDVPGNHQENAGQYWSLNK